MNKNAIYAVLLIGGGGYAFYDSYLPMLSAMDAEIADLQDKLGKANDAARKLPELKRKELELKEKLEASLSRLPSGAEVANLYGLVEPLMTKVGISSEQIGSRAIAGEAVSSSGIYRVHPITYSNISDVSFPTIVALLHELRTFERIINVKAITFSKTPNGKYTINTLTLETYSYIETEEAQ